MALVFKGEYVSNNAVYELQEGVGAALQSRNQSNNKDSVATCENCVNEHIFNFGLFASDGRKLRVGGLCIAEMVWGRRCYKYRLEAGESESRLVATHSACTDSQRPLSSCP
jgi:hypothetical protein